MDYNRRSFLTGYAAHGPPIRPPWSRDRSVLEACTGCGDCAKACPNGIISIGAGRLPELVLDRHECTFCAECVRACPEEVFDTDTTAFEHVVKFDADCLPRAGIDCRACQDACPEAAIRFRPRLGGPPLPELEDATCTGCGACLSVCPVDAIGVALSTEEAVGA